MQNGKFRVLFAPSIERQTPEFIQEFDTLEKAEAAKDAIANYTLHLHDKKLMKDYSNFGVVQVFRFDEWIAIGDLADYEDECECAVLGSQCDTCDSLG